MVLRERARRWPRPGWEQQGAGGRERELPASGRTVGGRDNRREGLSGAAIPEWPHPFPPSSMNPSHYETSDKYLGSFLLSQGAILTGYSRVSPRRVVFRF